MASPTFARARKRRALEFLILLLACPAGLPARVDAASVTLAPIRDNTLFADSTGAISNGAGPGIFAGESGTGIRRRALLEFDPSQGIPAAATIDSAILVLHVSQVSDLTPRVMTLNRVLAEWGEGTSSASGGSGAPSTAGDATWRHTFYPDAMWSTPGGDFDPSPSAATTVGGEGSYAWSGSGIVADLQAWRAQPASNHGWILLGDESTSRTTRLFDSREASTPENRPSLTIFYSLDTSPVVPTRWGALKSRYR